MIARHSCARSAAKLLVIVAAHHPSGDQLEGCDILVDLDLAPVIVLELDLAGIAAFLAYEQPAPGLARVVQAAPPGESGGVHRRIAALGYAGDNLSWLLMALLLRSVSVGCASAQPWARL